MMEEIKNIPETEEPKSDKSRGQELKEKLFYDQKDAFNGLSKEIRDAAQEFCVPYAKFLDAAKTEREAVNEGIKMAEAHGFVPYTFGQPVKAGDKFDIDLDEMTVVAVDPNAPVEPEVSEPETPDTPDLPVTGDASVLVFAILGVLAIVGAAVVIKVRN